MENNNNAAANSNVNTEVNNSPAGANAGTEKTFTQEEVNNIVQERLARERAKNEPTPAELREKELTARENKMSCKEYIAAQKYPSELLDLFDTADMEQFKGNVEKMKELFPRIFMSPGKIPIAVRGCSLGGVTKPDPIAAAFRLPNGGED